MYAFITSKTPTYRNTLHLVFSVAPQTNSWIEVIVSRVIVTTNPHNYFSEVFELGDSYDVQNIPVSTNTIAFLEISPSCLNGSLLLSIFAESTLFLYGALMWRNNITVDGHLPVQKYISLTHQLQYLIFATTNEEYFNVSVSLMWIHDIFSKYSLMLQTNSQSPYLSNRLKFVASSFNRSFTGSKKCYLLFKNATVQSLKNQHLKSWSEASDLCREAGGNLPYFISRTDLEELIALLKLSTDLLPIESLYIGVKINQSEEVNFSTKMWLNWLKKDSCVVVLLFVWSYLIFPIGFIQKTRMHGNEQIVSKTLFIKVTKLQTTTKKLFQLCLSFPSWKIQLLFLSRKKIVVEKQTLDQNFCLFLNPNFCLFTWASMDFGSGAKVRPKKNWTRVPPLPVWSWTWALEQKLSLETFGPEWAPSSFINENGTGSGAKVGLWKFQPRVTHPHPRLKLGLGLWGQLESGS